jgi:DNA-binding NarL/FixJ family response regulator
VTATPRVLLADDHPALARAVKEALEGSGFDVCAEAATGPEAVAAALEERPDLCLLDVDMPGGGIAAAREISTALPETAVVMLTVSNDPDDLVDALRAGAVGYLLKDADPARLPLTLRAVLDGEAALPRTLVHHVVREFQRTGGHRLALRGGRAVALTTRERDVLDLLRDGHTTAGIADRLTVSPVTVRRHIGSILHKLGVPDREAALALLPGDSRTEGEQLVG